MAELFSVVTLGFIFIATLWSLLIVLGKIEPLIGSQNELAHVRKGLHHTISKLETELHDH